MRRSARCWPSWRTCGRRAPSTIVKPDDGSLTRPQYETIRREARRALQDAAALGRFPTPVSDILAAARLEEETVDFQAGGVLATLRRSARGVVKRALSKVIGVLHASSRLVLVDQALKGAKRTFVRLHETAHGVLPWQREMYALVEDAEVSLVPEVADLFDREANVFAAEVLFQLDGFIAEAQDCDFGIHVPIKLARKYGASVYASVREYVRKNQHPCAVLVLDPPRLAHEHGFVADLRRVETSATFEKLVGPIQWAASFTPDDQIGRLVPLGKRKMTGKRHVALTSARGEPLECVAEAFTQGYQVFVLMMVCDSTH